MHDHHRRGRWITALVLGGALVLSACSTDRKLTEPKPVPVTEKNLTETLLTAADLPAGFTAKDGPGTPLSTEIITEHDCDNALTDLKPKLSVSTDITGNGVTLTDTAALFPGQGAAAEQIYRDVASKCSQVVVASKGVSIRSGPLDFGVLSDNTLPIRFEIEPTTGAITERDLIVIRQDDLLHVVRLVGPRPSDKALLDTAVRTAIGRLGHLHDDTT